MKSLISYLYENSKPWRARAEVYILKDNDLIVGYVKNSNYDGYIIPGGGIKVGENPDKAAKRECIEEIGIAVKDLKILSVKKIAYHESTGTFNTRNYSRDFAGAIFTTFVGDFDKFKYTKKPEFGYRKITIDRAIEFFTNNTIRLEKINDLYNYNKSEYVLNTLKRLKDII